MLLVEHDMGQIRTRHIHRGAQATIKKLCSVHLVERSVSGRSIVLRCSPERGDMQRSVLQGVGGLVCGRRHGRIAKLSVRTREDLREE